MRNIILTSPALFSCASLAPAIDTPAAKGTATKPYPLTTCIVSDEKLDEDIVTKVYNGQEIKFCCKKCIKDFEKDQSTYLKKITKDHKEGTVAEHAHEK